MENNRSINHTSRLKLQTFFKFPLSRRSLILGDDGGDVFCTGLTDRAPFVLIASLGVFFMDNDCEITVVVVLVPKVDICPPTPKGKSDLDFLRQPCGYQF